MMTLPNQMPTLSACQRKMALKEAISSKRRRHATIMHARGAFHNQVYNTLLRDTYMQPHFHPSHEKIEHIFLLRGHLDLLFFDEFGEIVEIVEMKPYFNQAVSVPAFCNHTYLVRSSSALTFETMDGVYDPVTWKILCDWAPREDSEESKVYHVSLCSLADDFKLRF